MDLGLNCSVSINYVVSSHFKVIITSHIELPSTVMFGCYAAQGKYAFVRLLQYSLVVQARPSRVAVIFSYASLRTDLRSLCERIPSYHEFAADRVADPANIASNYESSV